MLLGLSQSSGESGHPPFLGILSDFKDWSLFSEVDLEISLLFGNVFVEENVFVLLLFFMQ